MKRTKISGPPPAGERPQAFGDLRYQMPRSQLGRQYKYIFMHFCDYLGIRLDLILAFLRFFLIDRRTGPVKVVPLPVEESSVQ